MSAEVSVTQGPTPEPEELAAIIAAVQVVLASGSGAAPDPVPESPRWRFSGRWWSKPIASRRERPTAL